MKDTVVPVLAVLVVVLWFGWMIHMNWRPKPKPPKRVQIKMSSPPQWQVDISERMVETQRELTLLTEKRKAQAVLAKEDDICPECGNAFAMVDDYLCPSCRSKSS